MSGTTAKELGQVIQIGAVIDVVVVMIDLLRRSVSEKGSMQRHVVVLDGEKMRICGQHGLQRNAFDIVRSSDTVSQESPQLGHRRGPSELLQLEERIIKVAM